MKTSKTAAIPTPARKPRNRGSSLSETDQRVARRIAALRQEVGLTLRELGRKTSLSDAYLSRVENGQTAITLANLAKLAEIFATPVSSFLEEKDEEPKRIVFTAKGRGKKVRFRGRSGTLVSLLADEKAGKLMEPLIVDVASAPKELPLQGHPGEEFNYVLEGSCKFLFDSESFILNAGDSVYFDATIPHATHAVDGQPCRLLAVVSSQDFHVHRNIAKVLENRIQI